MKLPVLEKVLCIGGAVIDRKYHAQAPIVFETSNPVHGSRGFGGVARNVAENLGRLGTSTAFASIVGDDENGRTLLEHLRHCGVDVTEAITTSDRPTAEYAALLSPENELVLGIADMGIFELFTPSRLERLWPHIASSCWVFCDCNLPEDTLAALIRRHRHAGVRLAIDAVSTLKVTRLPRDLSGIDLLFMNLDEANTILGRQDAHTLEDARRAALGLQAAGAREAIVTMGSRGIAVAARQGSRSFQAVRATAVDITGAGDAMIAGTLHGLLRGEDTYAAARTGGLLGTLTIESPHSVHSAMSARLLAENRHRLAD